MLKSTEKSTHCRTHPKMLKYPVRFCQNWGACPPVRAVDAQQWTAQISSQSRTNERLTSVPTGTTGTPGSFLPYPACFLSYMCHSPTTPISGVPVLHSQWQTHKYSIVGAHFVTNLNKNSRSSTTMNSYHEFKHSS